MSKLKNIFVAILGLPEEKINAELSPETAPTWDSLNSVILMTEIERAFNIKFSFDEVMAVKNFSDICQLLETKGANPNE